MNPLAPAKRYLWVDWLRMLALAAVMMSHCCDPFLMSPDPALTDNPLVGFWGAVWQCTTRFSVPIFAVMTGFLLLPVRQEMGAFYKKRILRVLWPFLIWGALYALFPVPVLHAGGTAETVKLCFANVAEPTADLSAAATDLARLPLTFGDYGVHVWYIYLLIGLYLYLPIFSAWVEKATERQKWLVLGLWGLSLFIPWLSPFFQADGMEKLWGTCTWNSFGMLYYFAGFSGYMLLGHVIGQRVPLPWGRTLLLALPLLVLGYALTLIGFRMTQAELWNCGSLGELVAQALNPTTTAHNYTPIQETFLLYCSPNVAAMTLGVLLLFRHFTAAPRPLVPLLANMTACGFGIYLVHYFFVGPVNALLTAWGVPLMWLVPACVPFVFAGAWLFTALLRRLIPGKWLLG